MNLNQTADFLKSIRLFQDLDDTQRYSLAQEFAPISLKDGEELFREGKPGGDFYIITSGRIHLARWEDEKEISIGNLGAGEFLGHESYLKHSKHSANATAIGDSTLIMLTVNQFDWVLEQYPEIEDDIRFLARSYRIGRQQAFEWLGKDEVIHFIAKKHIYVLLSSLLLPLFLSAIGAIALIFSIPKINNFSFMAIAFFGTLFSVISLLWTLWQWIDWSNDFYIVTDQRVIWLEKIVLMYESRDEAPLDAILSTDINTDFLQRLLKSGDVVVNTFTSKIVMRAVDHPEQLNKTIQDYWQRSQSQAKQEEYQARVRILRDRLGLDGKERIEEEPAPQPQKAKIGFFQRLLNRVAVRYEENGTVTYRKHWYLLLRRIWLLLVVLGPLVLLLLARIFTIGSPVSFFGLAAPLDDLGIILIILATIIGISSPWWIYHIMDWSNDIYQVDNRKIFDIDRKPLGKDISKSAPLEKILNTSVEQTFLQRILNFGTVVINIGEAKFTFDGVARPSIVQQEIFSRYYARKQRLKIEDAEGERRRMVNWISIYHEEVGAQKKSGDEPDFY